MAERRIAEPEAPIGTKLRREPVLIFANFLNKSAGVQRIEQAETHALVETCTGYHIAQPQDLALGLKCIKNLRSVHDRLNEIRTARGPVHLVSGIT